MSLWDDMMYYLLHNMEDRPQGKMENWRRFCHSKRKRNTQDGRSYPSPSDNSEKSKK